jgi:glycosyltransferase involved in cell wall biosynthesis
MKICFATINGSPDYLGGYSLYHKNLIQYIRSNNIDLDISWVYFGNKNRKYTGSDGVHYFEIKSANINPVAEIMRHLKLFKFFKQHNFDIINSVGGIWTYFYEKRHTQKIIHTYHGTIYYFNKTQLKRFNLIKRIVLSPILFLSKMLDRPHSQVDKIICVSDKVKSQVNSLFNNSYNIEVIRTGVDTNTFKPRDRIECRKKLGLDPNGIYGLYVGGGGYWGKGLDRAVSLSSDICEKIFENYELLVIGADYNKVKSLIEFEQCVNYLENIPRELMPLYFSAADIFFTVSRYEGGAPTMSTSEAMSSGCIIVCSKDAEQEIIKNNINGLIFSDFNNANRIIKANKRTLVKNSLKTVSNYSLDKWGKKYLNALGVNNA